MKIGTDGVLLGGWVRTKKERSMLDIGTGTGLIALQLAQKSQAETIDAVEIDAASFEQAVENFENSPWKERLFCYHSSFQNFAREIEESYELIVSNPPFYKTPHPSKNSQRDKARFEKSLPFEDLMAGVAKLLCPSGRFAVIVPFREEASLVNIGHQHKLQLQKCCRVQGNSKSPVKRSLLEFGFEKKQIKFSDLQIESERHRYTKDYINLVKDFYIKM